MEEKITQQKLGAFHEFISQALEFHSTDIRTLSPLTLAYIGDSIYDLIVRTMIVDRGNMPVNKIHQEVCKHVKATAQAEIFHAIEEKLTEEELSVYKRGRNAKSFTSAKNAGIVEYRTATGLEALMGYLYLTNQMERLLDLLKPIVIKW